MTSLLLLAGRIIGPDQIESMEDQMGLTANSASLDIDEYNEKQEHLHHTELRIGPRKKKVSKTL